MLGAELVQIRLVLEHVHVQRAFLQRQVGADVVGELDQLDLVALPFQDRSDAFLDLIAKVADGGADDDFLLVGIGGEGMAAQGSQQGSGHGGLE